ncbi:hypothetical protein [Nocardia rhizosphaerae]|uniref:Uncharacterized protein n=1 Tax=Nocardia rhizosphaerae TaxID=1691571 RepID=A0ABV8LDZ1_9NOCA
MSPFPAERRESTVSAESAVRWPDPSPLDRWWTEVMDGVPQYRTAASVPPAAA